MNILSQIIVWCLTNIKCTWQRFGSCCTSVMPCSAIRGCEKSTSPACHFKSLNLYTSMHTKLQEILGSIGRGFAGVGSRIATRKRSLPQFDMCQSWDGAAFNIANGETKKRGKLMVGPAISRELFLCRKELRNGQTGSTYLELKTLQVGVTGRHLIRFTVALPWLYQSSRFYEEFCVVLMHKLIPTSAPYSLSLPLTRLHRSICPRCGSQSSSVVLPLSHLLYLHHKVLLYMNEPQLLEM